MWKPANATKACSDLAITAAWGTSTPISSEGLWIQSGSLGTFNGRSVLGGTRKKSMSQVCQGFGDFGSRYGKRIGVGRGGLEPPTSACCDGLNVVASTCDRRVLSARSVID